MEIDKQAIYLLAVAALEGARKHHQQQGENPNKPKDKKKSLPCGEKQA